MPISIKVTVNNIAASTMETVIKKFLNRLPKVNFFMGLPFYAEHP